MTLLKNMSIYKKESDCSLSSSSVGPSGAKGMEGQKGPTGAIGYYGASDTIVGGTTNIALGSSVIGGGTINSGIGGFVYGTYANDPEPEYDFVYGSGDTYYDKSVLKLGRTRIEMKAIGGKDNNDADEVEVNICGKRFNLFETLGKLEKLEARIDQLEQIIENNREDKIKVTI